MYYVHLNIFPSLVNLLNWDRVLFLHVNLGKMLSTNISFSLVVYFATLIVTSLVIKLINTGKQFYANKKV